MNKTSRLIFIALGALTFSDYALADVLCLKSGKAYVRAACRAREQTVQIPGPPGPPGPAGLAALNYNPCDQIIVGSWGGYLSDANYGDLEYCHINVAQDLRTSGWCRIITNNNAIINLTGGTVTSAPVNEDNQTALNCKVNGTFFFQNGVNAVITSTSTPDKNSLIGLFWNSAKLQGSFSATKLVNQ